MNLSQDKLTKQEWDSIEVPITSAEQSIIDIIIKGYNNVNIKQNNTLTILQYLKIQNTDVLDKYIYIKYLQSHVATIINKYNIQNIELYNENTIIKCMKKADIIRFSNTDKSIVSNKDNLFEYVIVTLLNDMYKCRAAKKGDWNKNYYTIQTLIRYDVETFNKTFKSLVCSIINGLEDEIEVIKIIEMGEEIIERNKHLLAYENTELYEHQKRLFTACKNPNPKLVLYVAPTGTGKTLSPLGLSEGHRIIFICAARHVGLALAKSAISSSKKVAFAFGCSDAGDIRLHYYAAKDYIKNKKSGRIAKVDNAVGDKVEIMICDIKSYLPAMHYMLAFNPKEKIILYWDEPTITMDYETHEFHEIIKRNWVYNEIPNIVLSSATLPQEEDIHSTIQEFKTKFDAEVYNIVSYDCKKTIQLINKEGYVEMPHYMYSDYADIRKTVAHFQKYKTLFRYIDLKEAIRFIVYINENGYECAERYKIKHYFPTIETVNMETLKTYYFALLKNIKPDGWSKIYNHMNATRVRKYASTINIVTDAAHTLTCGPSIFLTNDTDKIAKFCIQTADIPNIVLQDILSIIKLNSKNAEKINAIHKTLEDKQKKDEGKERKISNENRGDADIKRLTIQLQDLQANVKRVYMNPLYVPNTKEHISRYHAGYDVNNSQPFTSSVTDNIVEQIMLIDDVEDQWKILLLMGIGVFSSHKSVRYMEVMKSLAQSQKLYLIIASSDYIYGTNYQFCHSYIGKDLECMTQEKIIQAMGRIGRNNVQNDYTVRFRDNKLIHNLFNEELNKQEVINMNKLFCVS